MSPHGECDKGCTKSKVTDVFPRKRLIRRKWKYRGRNVCTWAIWPQNRRIYWYTCPSVWRDRPCHYRGSPCPGPLTNTGPRGEVSLLTWRAVPMVNSWEVWTDGGLTALNRGCRVVRQSCPATVRYLTFRTILVHVYSAPPSLAESPW
jgi:hypothetical protein